MTKKPIQNTIRPVADPAANSGLNVFSGFDVVLEAMLEDHNGINMQIIAIARLAKHALDSDMSSATDDAGHAFDAISRLASLANAKLDLALSEIGDSQLRDAA
ncbi:hypothetical protein [Lysobacter sp. FW306-1B-D06B]|uniref:hypothetical protein n=1 Tax=Lysobacter sp. FW306-1B-D06B TaxID=3140250 RepID=UPI0031406D4C